MHRLCACISAVSPFICLRPWYQSTSFIAHVSDEQQFWQNHFLKNTASNAYKLKVDNPRSLTRPVIYYRTTTLHHIVWYASRWSRATSRAINSRYDSPRTISPRPRYFTKYTTAYIIQYWWGGSSYDYSGPSSLFRYSYRVCTWYT